MLESIMKLTIKTLQQSTFTIEIEPDKTVKELKDKIEADHGTGYKCESQKLIYSGKILADESKLAEYNIDEKKFIVLMITRPPPKPKQESAPKQETPTTKKDAKPKDEKPKPAAQTTSSSSTTSTTTAPAANTTSTTSQSTATPAAAHRPPTSDGSGLMMGEPQMASRLASLMMQPQFRQIQDLIQQSPHLLSSTIEALAGSDPDMYNFMTENPDVFVNALNHPPLARNQTSRTLGSGSLGAAQQRAQQQAAANTRTSSAAAVSATGAASTRHQPVVDQILGDVTEHDKAAIERLKELGFSEYLAVQAYMACDKDEQLAADLLFQMD